MPNHIKERIASLRDLIKGGLHQENLDQIVAEARLPLSTINFRNLHSRERDEGPESKACAAATFSCKFRSRLPAWRNWQTR